MNSNTDQPPLVTDRRAWERPAIVFERSLQASAQGGPPQPPFQQVQGFLGPLGISGDTGQCK